MATSWQLHGVLALKIKYRENTTKILQRGCLAILLAKMRV